MRELKKYDQFDYQRFGIEGYWSASSTIEMLTCFIMGSNGYYDDANAQQIYNKLYDNVMRYVFFEIILCNKIQYIYDIDEHSEQYLDHQTVYINYVKFNRVHFLKYVKSNNIFKIDIDKLIRYLKGDELPRYDMMLVTNDGSNIIPANSNDAVVIEANDTDIDISLFSFEKAEKGWNLRFRDVVLNGVKDWAGMIYIKLLLQSPNKKIGVLKLQMLAGTVDTMYGNHIGDEQDNSIVSGSSSNVWEISDEQAIHEYESRLTQIEEELIAARKVRNRSRIERLENEKTDIEAHIKASNYKGKDPDVEKARKYILKVINDAIGKINKLELHCNYNDTPISSHLSRYIKTGASCSYTPPEDNIPPWKF